MHSTCQELQSPVMESEVPVIIPEDSPLRLLPCELSHKQILIFDGIRYASEMADIAYQRLFEKLQTIAGQENTPSTRDIAVAGR